MRFFTNSTKSPRSPSLDYFDYLTILGSIQVTTIAMVIKVKKILAPVLVTLAQLVVRLPDRNEVVGSNPC